MSEPIRSVAVLGGGVAAPMAALAIARAYGRLGVAVSWYNTGATPAPHEALVASPDMARFHKLLGVDDAALIDRASAVMTLGRQFVGWDGDALAPFVVAYGDAGTPFASLPFVQHWARARGAGLGVALEDFCVAAVAAKQGRVGEAPVSRQTVKHGWTLDAAGYAALLRAQCEVTGVSIVDWDGGEPVADLLIDADGAWMATRGGDREGAADVCDHVLHGSAALPDPIPLHTRVAAHRAGWTSLVPLGDRLAVTCAWRGDEIDETEARAAMTAAVGRPVTAGFVTEHWSRDRAQWVDNCIAIGAAARGVPLLDAADLLPLQLAIAQLVLLWPIARDAMPEAAIYNDELAGSHARIADFAALHFRLNGRRGEPFWDAARTAPISDALAVKIDLFAARGMFAHFGHEAHVEDAWALAFAGHGIVPRSFDPQAWLIDEQSLMLEFQRQLRAIAEDVRTMDPHAAALQRRRAGR